MELFSSNIGEAGVVTEQWWSIFGGDHRYDGGADPLIRIYYDGVGSKPSIEFRLFMAHGMGPIVCGDDYAAQKNCIDPAVTASDAVSREIFFFFVVEVFFFTIYISLMNRLCKLDTLVARTVALLLPVFDISCLLFFLSLLKLLLLCTPSQGNPNDFKNGGKSSWGSELLGHGSTRGAHKNTYRIPYGAEHGIKITMYEYVQCVVFSCTDLLRSMCSCCAASSTSFLLDILDILATTLLPNNQPNPNETSLHHFRTTAPSMHHNQLGKCLSTESSTITFEV